MTTKIAIIGAGSLGAALTHLITTNRQHCYVFDKNRSATTKLKRLIDQRKKYLHTPENVEECLTDCDYLIPTLPSQILADFYRDYIPILPKKTKIISVSKGFFPKTTQTISQALSANFNWPNVFVLSGPTFANEIIKKYPTSCLIASKLKKEPKELSKIFRNNYFSYQYSNLVMATELGGILKNCYAITLGLLAGQKYRFNSQSATIIKITKETQTLFRHLNLTPESVYSLSFLGDLIATGLNPLSRNYQFGQTRRRQPSTTEGLINLKTALKLAATHKTKLPILQQTWRIIKLKDTPKSLIPLIMA